MVVEVVVGDDVVGVIVVVVVPHSSSYLSQFHAPETSEKNRDNPNRTKARIITNRKMLALLLSCLSSMGIN